jgi:hypothetical protein
MTINLNTNLFLKHFYHYIIILISQYIIHKHKNTYMTKLGINEWEAYLFTGAIDEAQNLFDYSLVKAGDAAAANTASGADQIIVQAVGEDLGITPSPLTSGPNIDFSQFEIRRGLFDLQNMFTTVETLDQGMPNDSTINADITIAETDVANELNDLNGDTDPSNNNNSVVTSDQDPKLQIVKTRQEGMQRTVKVWAVLLDQLSAEPAIDLASVSKIADLQGSLLGEIYIADMEAEKWMEPMDALDGNNYMSFFDVSNSNTMRTEIDDILRRVEEQVNQIQRFIDDNMTGSNKFDTDLVKKATEIVGVVKSVIPPQ